MKVSDVMTRRVITVREDAPFKQIAETLLANDVSGLPVVDSSGMIVGVVTESDLLNKEAYPKRTYGFLHRLASLVAGESSHARKAAGLRARDLMSSPALFVSPEDSVRSAARLMIEANVKRLPVVVHGQLVGIVSRHDLMQVFARTDEELRRGLERFLARCLFTPPEHEIAVSVSGGVARLEGIVQYENDVQIAGELVRAFDGVVDVDNRLSFREKDPKRESLRRAAAIG